MIRYCKNCGTKNEAKANCQKCGKSPFKENHLAVATPRLSQVCPTCQEWTAYAGPTPTPSPVVTPTPSPPTADNWETFRLETGMTQKQLNEYKEQWKKRNR